LRHGFVEPVSARLQRCPARWPALLASSERQHRLPCLAVGAADASFPRARKPVCVLRATAERSMDNPFLWLVDTLINLYIWILIAAAILSWLIAFNVVNTRNQFVAAVGNFFYHVTEPALRPIRSVLPNLGGIDISPVILIIGLLFLERIIFWVYARIFV
jgi:YggT family protein